MRNGKSYRGSQMTAMTLLHGKECTVMSPNVEATQQDILWHVRCMATDEEQVQKAMSLLTVEAPKCQ